jgi:hypothetical protein
MLVCAQPDLIVYADIARWEIQQRWRRNETGNLGLDNASASIAAKYKCGYFVEWRAADRLKKDLLPRLNFLLDTNAATFPKMICGNDFRRALCAAAQTPFRVVPYFDPGPWGGHWMEDVCDLPLDRPNHAWCFDCVPEENSLLLAFGSTLVEIPAIDLVFAHPHQLLGESVHARFGTEFPIRFDFLDTMGGGNLSFQVHPLTEYVQDKFGMHYTQDESYYILDAGDDATVYLGLREDAVPAEMLRDLRRAQEGSFLFPAERYANIWPAHKHDHFLIPAGTAWFWKSARLPTSLRSSSGTGPASDSTVSPVPFISITARQISSGTAQLPGCGITSSIASSQYPQQMGGAKNAPACTNANSLKPGVIGSLRLSRTIQTAGSMC